MADLVLMTDPLGTYAFAGDAKAIVYSKNLLEITSASVPTPRRVR